MPMVEVTAPAKSKSAPRRGDSRIRGRRRCTASPIGTFTNMTQRQDAHSVSMPPATRPTAAPPIETAV